MEHAFKIDLVAGFFLVLEKKVAQQVIRGDQIIAGKKSGNQVACGQRQRVPYDADKSRRNKKKNEKKEN